MNTYSEDKMYESYSSEVERMQKCIDVLQQENKQLKEELKYTIGIVEHNRIISKKNKEIHQLKDNWNKLKVYIKTEIPEDVFIETEWFVSILDKMQELQGSDSK